MYKPFIFIARLFLEHSMASEEKDVKIGDHFTFSFFFRKEEKNRDTCALLSSVMRIIWLFKLKRYKIYKSNENIYFLKDYDDFFLFL